MSQAVHRSLMRCVLIMGIAGGLVGCHKRPEPAAPQAIAPKPVPKPNAVLPARQPGLWQTTVTEEGSEDQPQSLQLCIDVVTDAHLGILGTDLSGDRCVRKTVSHLSDGSWGLLAECDMGAGVSDEYSGAITGDYSSDYTMKLRSQTTGSALPQMNRVTTYTVMSKRLGDCAGDQRPGDVINDGVKVNLFDMSGVKPPVAKTGDKAAAAPTDDVE